MINVHVQVLATTNRCRIVGEEKYYLTTLLKDKEHPSEEDDCAESLGRQQH